jgi:hypothetical protein
VRKVGQEPREIERMKDGLKNGRGPNRQGRKLHEEYPCPKPYKNNVYCIWNVYI